MANGMFDLAMDMDLVGAVDTTIVDVDTGIGMGPMGLDSRGAVVDLGRDGKMGRDGKLDTDGAFSSVKDREEANGRWVFVSHDMDREPPYGTETSKSFVNLEFKPCAMGTHPGSGGSHGMETSYYDRGCARVAA